MNLNRQETYAKLEELIGDTRIVEYDQTIPNDNRIHVKMESENPFGSHYDRVYVDLFKHHEQQGNIKPGDKVLETSSGSAGVSFAGIGKQLGYHCITAMPAGGEKAREDAIRDQLKQESDLILTPENEYVNGFKKFLIQFLPRNKDVFFLNHSMGPRDKKTGLFTENEVTTTALESIAYEALEQTDIDYFVPAIGNGSSIVGPARVFKEYDIKTVGFETLQEAVAYDMRHPGKYKEQFGIEPGTMSRHRTPGIGYRGIDFPHLRIAEKEFLDDIMLISDQRTDAEYQSLTGRPVPDLVRWDSIGFNDLGRTSQAGIATALRLAHGVQDKDFLVLGYDSKNRYDS